MTRRIPFLLMAGVLAWLGAMVLTIGEVSAHVVYGNALFSDPTIPDPVTSGIAGTPTLGVGSAFSNQDRTVNSNAGWVAGLDAKTWADSHTNRFLYFNLGEKSIINFTITGTNTNGNGWLNPGYSLFQGVLPNATHDGQYFAGQSTFASWSPFAGNNANILANGGATTQHWGAYRSNANFTMANTSGASNTLIYTGLSGHNSLGYTVSGSYVLDPGAYSLVVGGANATDYLSLLSNAIATGGDYTNPSAALTAYRADRLARTFNIHFSATPAPIPAAVVLFGTGLAGLVAIARRRASL